MARKRFKKGSAAAKRYMVKIRGMRKGAKKSRRSGVRIRRFLRRITRRRVRHRRVKHTKVTRRTRRVFHRKSIRHETDMGAAIVDGIMGVLIAAPFIGAVAASTPPPPPPSGTSYDWNGSACVLVNNTSGTYPTLAACEAANQSGGGGGGGGGGTPDVVTVNIETQNTQVVGLNVSIYVTATATVGTLNSGSSDFVISWGDGGQTTGWQSGIPVSYTYTSAGTYTIIASVRDSLGTGGVATTTITVVAPASNAITSANVGTKTYAQWTGSPAPAYNGWWTEETVGGVMYQFLQVQLNATQMTQAAPGGYTRVAYIGQTADGVYVVQLS